MPPLATPEWAAEVAETANRDAQFGRVGRHFDANVLFEFGDDAYVMAIGDAEIEAVHDEPTFADWDVAVRAPIGTWETFLSESPPPFYNDLRPVWLQRDLEIEGNVTTAVAHWRALKRLIDLFREVTG